MSEELYKQYTADKKLYDKHSEKRNALIWMGVLTHVLLAIFGVLVLPVKYQLIWASAVVITALMILSYLVKMWMKSRKFVSFENWLKDYARKHY